jgi:hypothetical protein
MTVGTDYGYYPGLVHVIETINLVQGHSVCFKGSLSRTYTLLSLVWCNDEEALTQVSHSSAGTRWIKEMFC